MANTCHPTWRQEDQKLKVTVSYIVTVKLAWATRRRTKSCSLYRRGTNTQGWVPGPSRTFPATLNDAHQAPESQQCQVSDPVPTTRPLRTLWARTAVLWGRAAQLTSCHIGSRSRGGRWGLRSTEPGLSVPIPLNGTCETGCPTSHSNTVMPGLSSELSSVGPTLEVNTRGSGPLPTMRQHRCVPQSDHILSHSHPQTLW